MHTDTFRRAHIPSDHALVVMTSIAPAFPSTPAGIQRIRELRDARAAMG